MSTTTSTDTLSAHVRGYAQAVRLHLEDLGPDVADDLTDGLEADLTEAVLDDVEAPADAVGTQVFDLTARFGPADEYAAELRAAAGLPSAAPARRPIPAAARAIGEAWTVASDRWRATWRPLTSTPGWAAAVEFVRSLVPAWWILRGWVVAQVLLVSFTPAGIVLWPESTHGRVLVVAAIVVSIQWGRGKWVPRWAWFPRVVAVASVAAGLLAIPMMTQVEAGARPVVADYYTGFDAGWAEGFSNAQVSTVNAGDGAGTDGVWVDGVQVSNIFAYDAAGDPIRDVQLFDDRGRPIRTIGAGATWDTWSVPDVPGSWSFQPALASDGRTRWNVYPLSAVPADQVGLGDDEVGGYSEGEGTEYPLPPTGVQPQELPWPFLKAPTAIEDDDAVAGSGAEESDEPAHEGLGHDRSANDPAGDTVRPGDRPASGGVEPTLEATEAD
ncbi:hypothetical protein [Promicromonospora panici]|uniref:hypothetical protein n=1 Tax=Promicromonospora panici TaxID=2219658 RepID=UPI00101CAC0E|nr:hypothetical protein [Promicromonospora panici]